MNLPQSTIEELRSRCGSSARQIAIERIRSQGMVSIEIAQGLTEAAMSWKDYVDATLVSTHQNVESCWFAYRNPQAIELYKWLNFVNYLATVDPILGQELSWDGIYQATSFLLLQKIIPKIDEHYSNHSLEEQEEDAINDIRDAASEVASIGLGQSRQSLLNEERVARLPLQFKICSIHQYDSLAQTVLIHQVTTRQSAQEDVGFGEEFAKISVLSLACVRLTIESF